MFLYKLEYRQFDMFLLSIFVFQFIQTSFLVFLNEK